MPQEEEKSTSLTSLALSISLIVPASVATEPDLHVLDAPNPVWGVHVFMRRPRIPSPFWAKPQDRCVCLHPVSTWACPTQSLSSRPTVGPRAFPWTWMISKIHSLPISLPCLERKRLLDCELDPCPQPSVPLSVLIAASRPFLTTTNLGCWETVLKNKL